MFTKFDVIVVIVIELYNFNLQSPKIVAPFSKLYEHECPLEPYGWVCNYKYNIFVLSTNNIQSL